MLGSKFVKFLMSILKWQINSSSNFASLLIVMTHKSSVNFNLIHFLLWPKGSHQSPNFYNFKCSVENLPNSSCQFLNYKSILLRILHQTSVSWKITSLYFFSLNIIYFGQKQPIKVQIFQTFVCWTQNLSNFPCQFWNNKWIALKLFYHSSV